MDVANSQLLIDNSLTRLCKFIKGDTACIRDTNPKVEAMQQEHLDPLIAKFEEIIGPKLKTTKSSLSHKKGLVEDTVRDPEQVEIYRKYLETLNPWELLASEISISATRSVCIGTLAVIGEIGSADAVYKSRVEEEFQALQYGKVEGAHDVDEANVLSHLSCSRLLFQGSK